MELNLDRQSSSSAKQLWRLVLAIGSDSSAGGRMQGAETGWLVCFRSPDLI
jgi:hypothetical protein